MKVKYFVIRTDLLLPLNVNFSYFKIQIFMLLNWNPNPQCKKYAIESRIRIRRFFGRIAIPDRKTDRYPVTELLNTFIKMQWLRKL